MCGICKDFGAEISVYVCICGQQPFSALIRAEIVGSLGSAHTLSTVSPHFGALQEKHLQEFLRKNRRLHQIFLNEYPILPKSARLSKSRYYVLGYVLKWPNFDVLVVKSAF